MKNQTEIKAEAGKQELFITREFDAPRELVFKAFTDPELLVQWLGCESLTMKMERNGHGRGSSWRDIFTDPNGNEFGFHGVCHEQLAPEMIIRTFEFEGLPEPGHVCLETVRLEILPGYRTKVAVQSVFQSIADRDGMLQSGMETGVFQAHDRLDGVLAKELVN
ncbi:MAG TPA: SRPBCC family protein [Mucilaginibacter sp.]|nr:SRPBCC family protein [Mucilaginibacter sp.]